MNGNILRRWKNQSSASFLINLRGKELPNVNFLFVTNKANEISKVELDVNGKVFNKKFKVYESSVVWIDLPKYKSAEYKYKSFDKNGNLIEE